MQNGAWTRGQHSDHGLVVVSSALRGTCSVTALSFCNSRFFFGDGTVWHDALPPRGVRDAAMELLHAMAALIEHLLASFVSIATGELASVSQGGILQACDVVVLDPTTPHLEVNQSQDT